MSDTTNDNTTLTKEASRAKTLDQTIKPLQDDLETQKRQKYAEIRKLTEENKTEREQHKFTIATLKQEIDNMTTTYNRTTKKLTQRSKILENLIKKLTKPQEKTQSPLKVSFIADSNRKRITDHLRTPLQRQHHWQNQDRLHNKWTSRPPQPNRPTIKTTQDWLHHNNKGDKWRQNRKRWWSRNQPQTSGWIPLPIEQ